MLTVLLTLSKHGMSKVLVLMLVLKALSQVKIQKMGALTYCSHYEIINTVKSGYAS